MRVSKTIFLNCILAALVLFVSPAAAKTPVILDTDIGDDIDDTWALAMFLKSPDLDLKLVTTTCGKAEYRAKLIAKLLTAAGRTDIPIGLGEGGLAGTGGQQAWCRGLPFPRHGDVGGHQLERPRRLLRLAGENPH